MSGPNQPSSPNTSNSPLDPRQPFLWEQNSPVLRFLSPKLNEGQLEGCAQFAASRQLQGRLTPQECRDLMAQLNLNQATQAILPFVDFVNRADQSNPNFINLTNQLLSPINSLGVAYYSYGAIQRLEFADPALWQQLMNERDYYEQNGQSSPSWLHTAYSVYVEASQLIAQNDDDYQLNQIDPDNHFLH